MAIHDSFDDRIFETYAHSGGERIMPKIRDDQIGSLYPTIYTLALEHAAEKVGIITTKQQEIVSRTNFWPAGMVSIASFQDERFDVPSLPQTNRFHADMSIPTAINHLGSMFVGYHRLTETLAGESPSAVEHVAELSKHATDGVVIDSMISRILITLGAKYGIEMVGPDFSEILQTHLTVSERESRRLTPDGSSVGWSLYEEAQLHGAPTPKVEDVANVFEAVAYVLQFQKTSVILDTLGLLSLVSPALQKFSLDFYKQHKAMLFADKPERTSQALDKLLKILAVQQASIDSERELDRQAVFNAKTYLEGRKIISDVIMGMEVETMVRINAGWYESQSPLNDSAN